MTEHATYCSMAECELQATEVLPDGRALCWLHHHFLMMQSFALWEVLSHDEELHRKVWRIVADMVQAYIAQARAVAAEDGPPSPEADGVLTLGTVERAGGQRRRW